MPISFTPPMKQRVTRRTLGDASALVRLFSRIARPEHHGRLYAETSWQRHGDLPEGSAFEVNHPAASRKVAYQTIGHELTHLIQALAYGDRSGRRSSIPGRVPSGEKQCDIWTLAREPLFCDDAPTYIKMPRIVRDHWPDYAEAVRDLCISAIAKRHTHRHYIRWLEDEIAKLPATQVRKKTASIQLTLPW
jgi:hypothetical protein